MLLVLILCTAELWLLLGYLRHWSLLVTIY